MNENKKHGDLITASGKGDTGTIEKLLGNNVDVDIQGRHGYTPLIGAARNRHAGVTKNYHIKVAKALSSADQKNQLEDTASTLQISKKKHLRLVDKLLAVNADVNIQNKEGNTVLIEASGEGHLEVAKKLIEARAKIDIQNNRGVTAFIRAARNGHIQLARELIDVKSEFGDAVNLAAMNGHQEIAELARNRSKNRGNDRNNGTAKIAIATSLAFFIAAITTLGLTGRGNRRHPSSDENQMCTHPSGHEIDHIYPPLWPQ